MKTKMIIYFILSISLASCSHRFQVHDISSADVQTQAEDVYLYEGEDIGITYDFWSEGGLVLFLSLIHI